MDEFWWIMSIGLFAGFMTGLFFGSLIQTLLFIY